MNADDLLAEASRRGILLTARGGRLTYDAPHDAMDAGFRASLLAGRAELLALMEGRPAATRSTPGDAPVGGPWVPRPVPWRSVTVTWPIPRRERWGRLANRYAEEGLPFPEDERRAFEEIEAAGDRIPP